MKMPLIAAAVVLSLAGGAYAWMTVSRCAHESASAGASCEAKEGGATQASGAPRGNYDLAMAGCRFSCGTKESFEESAIAAQPGVETGDITRCPVSGVAFQVDEARPRVVLAEHSYVFCCDVCAEKFRATPRRFARL